MMTSYNQWNQALTSYFISGMPQGSQISLSLDDEVLECFGQNLSFSPMRTDFCATVKDEAVVDGEVRLSCLQGRFAYFRIQSAQDWGVSVKR
ncbi:MAG: hypothetical protein ABFS56_19935 [Pseudomonadota bacterium]